MAKDPLLTSHGILQMANGKIISTNERVPSRKLYKTSSRPPRPRFGQPWHRWKEEQKGFQTRPKLSRTSLEGSRSGPVRFVPCNQLFCNTHDGTRVFQLSKPATFWKRNTVFIPWNDWEINMFPKACCHSFSLSKAQNIPHLVTITIVRSLKRTHGFRCRHRSTVQYTWGKQGWVKEWWKQVRLAHNHGSRTRRV